MQARHGLVQPAQPLAVGAAVVVDVAYLVQVGRIGLREGVDSKSLVKFAG